MTFDEAFDAMTATPGVRVRRASWPAGVVQFADPAEPHERIEGVDEEWNLMTVTDWSAAPDWRPTHGDLLTGDDWELLP